MKLSKAISITLNEELLFEIFSTFFEGKTGMLLANVDWSKCKDDREITLNFCNESLEIESK